MGHFTPLEIIYASQVKASNDELAFSQQSNSTVTCKKSLAAGIRPLKSLLIELMNTNNICTCNVILAQCIYLCLNMYKNIVQRKILTGGNFDVFDAFQPDRQN